MKWNNPLTNCANMFRYLTNITKADLSKFDSSKVETMYCMFYGCSSLQSIDLSNLKTPLLTNIRSMFNSCRSLISLDFSSFDTSLISLLRPQLPKEILFKDSTLKASSRRSHFFPDKLFLLKIKF